MSRENYLELRNHFGQDFTNLMYNYTIQQGLKCPPELFFYVLQEWCQRKLIGIDVLVKILDNHFQVMIVPTRFKILYL